MTERRKSCDVWHPDLESRFELQGTGKGKKKRMRCLECTRSRVLSYRDSKASRQEYGVMPRLSWPAPEFLVRQ